MNGLKNYLRENSSILTLLLAALLVRLILSPFGTLSLDQNTFIAWSQRLAIYGFGKFYEGWSDYLPGYLYVLWFLGKVRTLFPIPDVILYKLPAILSDTLTGFLIYGIVKKIKGEKIALASSVLYLFNIAILANSTLWGQVDSITAFLAVLTIYLVSVNPYFSAIALSLGTLVKPQEAFIAPVILVIMFKDKWKPLKAVSYVLASFFVFVVGFVPFNRGFLPSFIFERLSVSFSQYPYTSVNAFNFWGIFGFWKPDNIVISLIGLALVVSVFVFSIVKLWSKKNFEYLLGGIIFLSTFLFITRMHERHLLVAFPFLAIASSFNPLIWVSYLGLSLTYVLNLFYSFVWISNSFESVFPSSFVTIVILFNTSLLAFILWAMNKKIDKSWFISLALPFRKGVSKEVGFPKIEISKRKANIFLIFILTFAFVTRVFQLGSPPNEYFDEVYHAFTAKTILHGNPKAWEWWNTPPEGFAYEWTHPPLAKLGMVAGMLVFGENSFGYRIPGAILGVGIILLVYLISKELFKDELIGLLSAAVLSLDGLTLVMSRIGMNDTYFLFFSLLSIYFFMKEKNFLSAFSLGLSLSSKWSAVWTIPILVVLWLWQKKKIRPGYLWFLILPPLVYLATYIPMFLTGHGFDIFWGMQKQMWWYHTRLKATHPYTSPWWSWPLMLRPVYLYTSNEVGGFVSRIYAIGNPAVFWTGLVSIVISLLFSFIERSKKVAFVVFSYLIFFVPWALSPRIMFIYHYLPSIPFLAIAIGYTLRRSLRFAIPLLAIFLLFFLYFYPHWAGISIPLWLDTSYYWFSSWR